MISEQPTRKMARDLSDAGWTKSRTVGSHSVWTCRTGKHHVTLPDGHRTISPGVVRKIRQAIALCRDECKEDSK